MMEARIAYFAQKKVNSSGGVIDESDARTSLSTVLHSSNEMRVKPGATSPNSHDFPTLATYILREAADGFKIQHLSNTMIVTYDS